MDARKSDLEIDLQLRRRGRGRGVEKEPVFLVHPETELEIEAERDLEVPGGFQLKAGHADVEFERAARRIDQRDLLLEAQMHGQPFVAVQGDIELAVAQRIIQGVAGLRIDQQVEPARPEGVPEGLLDRVCQRGQPVAIGVLHILPQFRQEAVAEILDEMGDAGQAIADQRQPDV